MSLSPLLLASCVTLISLSELWKTPAVPVRAWLPLHLRHSCSHPCSDPWRAGVDSSAFDLFFLLNLTKTRTIFLGATEGLFSHFGLISITPLVYSLLILTCLQDPMFCLLSLTKGISSIGLLELHRFSLPSKPRHPSSRGK